MRPSSGSDRRNPPINGVKVGLAHAVLPPAVLELTSSTGHAYPDPGDRVLGPLLDAQFTGYGSRFRPRTTPGRDEPASQGTRVSRMKKFHLNAGNSGVQLLRSTYSGTLQYTHSKFANRTAAVTRNTQRTPKAAATAPPESGPIELPRNIAEAVMP